MALPRQSQAWVGASSRGCGMAHARWFGRAGRQLALRLEGDSLGAVQLRQLSRSSLILALIRARASRARRLFAGRPRSICCRRALAGRAAAGCALSLLAAVVATSRGQQGAEPELERQRLVGVVVPKVLPVSAAPLDVRGCGAERERGRQVGGKW